jgi:hypothetical protein
MLKNLLFSYILFICTILYLKAEEGLWPPFLLNDSNIKEMHDKGLKLSAEDIFSIENISLKDAVVLFNSGCTGEVISGQGLLLTNYHCAFRYIQSLSSVDNDYMTSGYWARSRKEELPVPDLTVSILTEVNDVTDQLLKNIDDNLNENDREKIINKRIDSLTAYAAYYPNSTANIKSFYYGNRYFMFIYEVFKDIRLAAAPPSEIGKFGGDTDNWIWPRHTGDFSIFRIYSDSTNNPAEYSPDNIPYKPKKYLRISLKGYKEGDFTMVYGYPARTHQFLTSHAISIIKEKILPYKIKFREERQELIKTGINNDNEIRIKYAAKYESAGNALKKWRGILQGFERMNIIEIKKNMEMQFNDWVNADSILKVKYGYLISEFAKLYNELIPYYTAEEFLYETIFSTELVDFVSLFSKHLYLSEDDSLAQSSGSIKELSEASDRFFRNYSAEIDEKVFARMLELYYNHVDRKFHPEMMDIIIKKTNGNFSEYSKYIYSKSIFNDQAKVNRLLQNFSMASSAKIEDDPAYQFYISFINLYRDTIKPAVNEINKHLNRLYRIYINGLTGMQPERKFYPDANHTLRLSYGNIKGYKPADAINYRYFTSLQGIIEKSREEIYDYTISYKLKNFYDTKDFGIYGMNGTMPVCFIASNHTSGGNSGSPVFNAEGHLIGINFDRVWEGTMSDYIFDPEICRNISVDVRYILFIIDKYARAGYLLNELSLVY